MWDDFGGCMACNCVARDSREVHMSVLSREREAEAEAEAQTRGPHAATGLAGRPGQGSRADGEDRRDGCPGRRPERRDVDRAAHQPGARLDRAAHRAERPRDQGHHRAEDLRDAHGSGTPRGCRCARARDVTAPRRRWPQVVAGTGMLVAVGAAAAVVLRRRKNDRAGGEPGKPAEAVTGLQAAQDGQLGADGSGAEEDVEQAVPGDLTQRAGAALVGHPGLPR